MAVVGAYLLPGSPLPMLVPENPPWLPLVDGMKEAGRRVAALDPDVVVVYSTQWLAVLDQLWLTRPLMEGVHVDETWHEYGEIPFSLRVDRAFAETCVDRANRDGPRSKAVDYDAFPVDTGTLVAAHYLDPGGTLKFAMTSNNLYHDSELTRGIGALVRGAADEADRRIVAVGVGGMSGTVFRDEIEIAEDRIASPDDDQWNRKILAHLEKGELAELSGCWESFASEARVDMGFKHLAFLLGALGGSYAGAELLAYGPTYGAGAAVVAFQP